MSIGLYIDCVMELRYTTSVNTGSGPSRPSGSLGGYISELPVRNDAFDNLFGEISTYAESKARTEYRALVLLNDGAEAVNNVTLYMTTKGERNLGKILIAPVAMSRDSEDRLVMERVGDVYSRPFVADFQETGVDNKLNIGAIEVGDAVGIWVCREIVAENVKADYNDVYQPTKDKPYWFEPIPKETEEGWQLNVEWE